MNLCQGDIYATAGSGAYRFYVYALDSGRMVLCIHEDSEEDPVELKNLVQHVN